MTKINEFNNYAIKYRIKYYLRSLIYLINLILLREMTNRINYNSVNQDLNFFTKNYEDHNKLDKNSNFSFFNFRQIDVII